MGQLHHLKCRNLYSSIVCPVEKKSNLLTFLLSDWCENLSRRLKDGQTLILTSQGRSVVKVSKALNREEVIPLKYADSGMSVRCEYIANS